MRLLLDENVPIRLLIPGHQSAHVRDLGWLGTPDRELATRATAIFDAVITLDQALPGELVGLDAHPGVIVSSPRSHRLPDVNELIPAVLDTLKSIRTGEIVRLFRPPSVLT